jgi:hypothetical protein
VFNEVVRNKLLGPIIESLQEKNPLTNLEGIDTYDRARWAEEGVTNIESLAHHDFIDLILTTRIPVPRLVDWVDQAILYLHVSDNYPEEPAKPAGRSAARESTASDDAIEVAAKQHSIRQYWRSLGIRTATDFICAYNAADTPDKRADIIRLLDPFSNFNAAAQIHPVDLTYRTLVDGEWIKSILHWRTATEVHEQTFAVDENGRIIEEQAQRAAA